jgi:hypothetical protein
MKTSKGKMTMFLSNLSYSGHLDERWRDLKQSHYAQYQVNAILQVYFIVGLCLLDIEMFSYIF